MDVGLQIIGPLDEDGTAIAFAELVADVAGGYEPPSRRVSESMTRMSAAFEVLDQCRLLSGNGEHRHAYASFLCQSEA